MAKVTDIVKRWHANNIKPREELDDVLKVLKYFEFEVRKGKGSHYVVTHLGLDKIKCSESGLRNEFTVPTIKGRRVAKIYVSRILKYIEMLEDIHEN